MARLSTVDLCVLTVWGVLLSCSSAQQEFFPQNATNMSWVNASTHCQRCFSELVTVTPENSQRIANSLSSEHWVGLRKRPVNRSNYTMLYPFNDTSTFWSQWINGDLLSFQNWYPGYPVFKSPLPKQDCCSCSCTCPAPHTTTTAATATAKPGTSKPSNTSTNTSTTRGPGTTDHTSAWTNASITTPTLENTSFWSVGLNTTLNRKWAFPLEPFESECVKKPMEVPGPDPNENYIEDPCVAMLSFGAWVERECSDLLPFICYEDQFNGEVNVTDIKNSSAQLSWLAGPGDISHYRLEVNGSVHLENTSQLNYLLLNLNPGTLYSVEVFPVKCERDLNPETTAFYTVPNTVINLTVINQTEGCVSLTWLKPSGNADLYVVDTHGVKKFKKTIVTKSESVEVSDLTPGSRYEFSLKSGVRDHSEYSEETKITAFTRPVQVSDLVASNITDHSLTLTWNLPRGEASEYVVETSWEGEENKSYKNWTTKRELHLEKLPSGTKITLTVAALVDNNKLEGESLTEVCFTKSKPIRDLNLTSTADSITATWGLTEGSPQFTVDLLLGEKLNNSQNVTGRTNFTATFDHLTSATNYSVSVYSVTGNMEGIKVSASIFTSPNPPHDPKCSECGKTHLTFSWKPPINSDKAEYLVTLNSSFWGQHWSETLNKTTHTFRNLKSGSNYNFYVQTKAGNKGLSEAAKMKAMTEPSKKEITLSMVCSSKESLLCDRSTTRSEAFDKLKSHFTGLLGKNVFWELQRVNITNTGS